MDERERIATDAGRGMTPMWLKCEVVMDFCEWRMNEDDASHDW